MREGERARSEMREARGERLEARSEKQIPCGNDRKKGKSKSKSKSKSEGTCRSRFPGE
jgi:hypothetical protein